VFITETNIQDMLNRLSPEEKDKRFKEMILAFAWFVANGDERWKPGFASGSVSALAHAALEDATAGY